MTTRFATAPGNTTVLFHATASRAGVGQRLVAAALGVLLAAAACVAQAAPPAPELLWPNAAPGAKGDRPADKPTLTIYHAEPAKANGAAVVICPGGGYGFVAMEHEGHQIARWLNSLGVTGVILDYRHRQKGYGHPAPLQDAQRAVRTVRARASAWRIDPKKIGILGFSAGGHLASSAGTHFDSGDPGASDPIGRVSCRPDFMILCYAVLALDEKYTHRGSQENLLGRNADPALVRSMSSEKQVTRETPPTFLWHTDEDTGVPSENSVAFYLAMRNAGVPGELHVYQKGPHGIGLGAKTPGASDWPNAAARWMQVRGIIAAGGTP
jgi:acetyl esterase/lipase